MFKRVLIANRGEIALRIIRACKEMGIETVAVHSTEDADQIHVKLSDYSVCIGGPRSFESYLNMAAIVTVALKSGCDALHPGYGFLSENPEFVRVLQDLDIKFIGPSADTIASMGDKSVARQLMIDNDVPVVPGSDGEVETLEEAELVCNQIGYPVLIKASRGGGGKGMRKVFAPEELENEFFAAKREAQASFDDEGVYIEKLIINPKHIEVQILRDQFGNTIHLGERQCSVQRRNQKMIEEAPAKGVTEQMRKQMGDAAIKAAEASNYENAGTVEFILDEKDNFYFIEMNTRIQVEHPVTEMVTGVDLVKEQIRIASGLKLSKTQEEIQIDGHAIEVRVNGENPMMNFMPSTGHIDFFFGPGGFNTRFDTYLYNGAKVSPHYDSMLGKIIVKGETRLEAIRRMRRAIEETFISGIHTNLGYQYAILFTYDFIRGDYNTGFIEEHNEEIIEMINRIEDINGR
ncbi:MAG: acetyl-CoA carboxylase biotin carboxylase subunit [Tissierellia bacterium]|nr:acetyl-CoA carboxylase biotin carboxylase subunit [Tissierellia bacterium]